MQQILSELQTKLNYLCSVIICATYGRNVDKCTLPGEAGSSIATKISCTSASVGQQPKARTTVPTSRISIVLDPA